MRGVLDGMMAGYGIAVPVGAVSILIVTTGMASGFRRGFAAGAGAATADFIYAAAASAAGTALVLLLQPVARYFRLAGGLALLIMAGFGLVRGLRKAADPGGGADASADGTDTPPDGANPPRSTGTLATWAQFLGITLVNPLTVVYFAALILGRPSTGQALFVDRLWFVLGAAGASLSWQTLLATIGSILHGRVPGRFRAAAVIAGNIIVAGLGARILVLAATGMQ